MSHENASAAWLVLAVGDDRQHGGNDGYDDEPAVHYSWDDRVPNHAEIKVGDIIAIWDKKALIGVSVIEEIVVGAEEKRLYTCPDCGLAGIKARRRRTPLYKCYKCRAEFDVPNSRIATVRTYRSRHDSGWVDLAGALSGAQLRELCELPNSQLSLRRLRWDGFRTAVEASPLAAPLRVLDATSERVVQGHSKATVRVRLGQGAFRSRLLVEYGAICAFTGMCPPEALEAGHLYSYASTGKHHRNGGLLFRRDLHRLFDLGHIVINPMTSSVDVSDVMMAYPLYAALAHQPVKVDLAANHLRWLAAHWTQHRS